MGCTQNKPAQQVQEPEKPKEKEEPPPPPVAKPSDNGDDKATPKAVRRGDVIMVNSDGGFEGEVLRCTTTDVLVKTKDNQEKWCDMEDVILASNGPPLQTEVKVGEEVSTERGISGTVLQRTTTDVCVKTKEGNEIWVDVEEITFLKIEIQGALGLRNADWVGKSDPYCICQLEGKPQSKRQTVAVTDRLNPIWNFEARMTMYARGDSLNFDVYDKDTLKSEDDFLGKASLTSDDLLVNGGYYGDLQLLNKDGTPGMGTLRIRAQLEHLAPEPEAPPREKGPRIVEVKVDKKPCCC